MSDNTTITTQSKQLHLKSTYYPELVSTCSCRSVTRCREPVPLGHYDCSNAKDTYNGEVDKSRLRGAIEGVVQPRHEGAHDQEGNARVVKSEEREWERDKQVLRSARKLMFSHVYKHCGFLIIDIFTATSLSPNSHSW